MTVNELLITQILRSYNELQKTNQIPPIAPYSRELINHFDDILNAPVCNILSCMMNLAKNPVLAERKATIFKKRELNRMGVDYEHELTLE